MANSNRDPRSDAEKAIADLKRNAEMDMSLTESPLERQPSVTSDTFGVHDKPARLRSGTDEGPRGRRQASLTGTARRRRFHHELRTKADARRSCLSDLTQAPPHHPCQALRKGSGVSWKLAIQNPRFVEQQVRSVVPKRGVVLAC